MVQRLIAIGAVVVLPLAACRSAPPKDAADAALAEARRLAADQGPRAALPAFERAARLYGAAGDRRGEAIAVGNLGTVHKNLGNYARALQFHERALAAKRAIGDRLEEARTLSNIGLVYYATGDYTRALGQYEAALAIFAAAGEPGLEAAVRNNRGLVYDELGQYDRARQEYTRAIEAHREAGNDAALSDALGNAGGVHLLLGEFPQARARYLEALAISEKLQDPQRTTLDLGNLAEAELELGLLPEALARYQRAVTIAREAGLRREEADWHLGMGRVHLRGGRLDAARDATATAVRVFEAVGAKQRLVEAYAALGEVHVALGDAATAETAYRRSLELARELNHPRGTTAGLLAIGDLEWRRRRDPAAVSAYAEARDRAAGAGDLAHMARASAQLALTRARLGQLGAAAADATAAIEQARRGGAKLLEAEAHYARARVALAGADPERALAAFSEAAALARSTGLPDLRWRVAFGRGEALERTGRDEDALQRYLEATAVIEEVRSRLRERHLRAGYIEDKHDVYAALVRLLVRLGRTGAAFEYAEKLRARGYRALLEHGAIVSGAAGRRAQAALEARVRRLMTAIEEEALRAPGRRRASAIAVYSAELAAAEREYLAGLERILPGDRPASAGADVVSLGSIQRRIGPSTALLEFVVSREALTTFVVRRDALRAVTLPLQAGELHARVDLLRQLVQQDGSDEWRQPAGSLYELLVAPLRRAGWLDGVRHLLIVPHAELHYLPFAVLRPPDAAGPVTLVDQFDSLTVLPAATALARAPHSRRPDRSVLALAPQNANLPHAGLEAAAVGRVVGPRARVAIGTTATETVFKQEAGGYRLLHLATHGVFNTVNPLFSGVQLEPDEWNDGKLQVYEILGLRLAADLVTLSACDTALGTGQFAGLPAGEDMVGLTQAFLSAGTASVLATLWQISDRATPPLMERFYARARAASRAVALAAAQRELKSRPGPHQHPYYWGAFVLIGTAD